MDQLTKEAVAAEAAAGRPESYKLGLVAGAIGAYMREHLDQSQFLDRETYAILAEAVVSASVAMQSARAYEAAAAKPIEDARLAAVAQAADEALAHAHAAVDGADVQGTPAAKVALAHAQTAADAAHAAVTDNAAKDAKIAADLETADANARTAAEKVAADKATAADVAASNTAADASKVAADKVATDKAAADAAASIAAARTRTVIK